MEYLIGFIIAVFIALTGVGAGTITTPLLVLVLGVPAGMAVSVGLMFSAAVKLVLLPMQIWRKQVAWRTLAFMLAGGVPGVLVGSFLLHRFVDKGATHLVNGVLGVVLVATALWQICLFVPTSGAADGYAGSRAAAAVADVAGGRGGWILFRGRGSAGKCRPADTDAACSGAGGGDGYCVWLFDFVTGKRSALVYRRSE